MEAAPCFALPAEVAGRFVRQGRTVTLSNVSVHSVAQNSEEIPHKYMLIVKEMYFDSDNYDEVHWEEARLLCTSAVSPHRSSVVQPKNPTGKAL